MNQLQVSQPYFKIRISGFGSTAFAEVEKYVSWGVSYEEQADLNRVLTFTIDKFGAEIIHYLRVGMVVSFYGGTLREYAKIFSGNITKLRTRFSEDGTLAITVESLSRSWNQLGKNLTLSNVYPDLKSTRAFAKSKPTLRISEIVRGICEENGMEVALIDIPKQNGKDGDEVLSVARAVQQNRISDWVLLNRLAKRVNCTIWTEFEGENEKLYFVDRSKVRNSPDVYYPDGNEISFLFPAKGTLHNDKQALEDRERFFIQERLRKGQVLLSEVSVEEDIASQDSISYGATKFDMESGEEVSLTAEIITREDGKRFLQFYELDYDKVDALEKTNPALARQLREMNPTSIPWEITRQFLKTKDMAIDEDVSVYDQAFFGVTITATCRGSVHIRSQRTYKVEGVLRYGTRDASTRYWLYGLRHRWEEDGFWTDLTFKR